ncbi:MAG: VOC family protein [Flavitalea sp.]
MTLKLLVIRSANPQKLSEFYAVLGLAFEYHCHGNSPMHYSADMNGTTLEIYPLTKSQQEPDRNLRLGFSMGDFETVIQTLRSMDIKIHTEPTNTDFGYMAVVGDPDGRKIEIYKN